MKNRFNLLLISIVSFLCISGCVEDEVKLDTQHTIQSIEKAYEQIDFSNLMSYKYEIDWSCYSFDHSDLFGTKYYEFTLKWQDGFNPISTYENRISAEKDFVNYKLIALERSEGYELLFLRIQEFDEVDDYQFQLNELSSFSGTLKFFDKEESQKHAFLYVDGYFKGELFEFDSTKNSRIDPGCFELTTYQYKDWYKETSSGWVLIESELIGVRKTLVCNGSDPGGTPTGGTSSGGGDGNYVPCGDPVHGCFYVIDDFYLSPAAAANKWEEDICETTAFESNDCVQSVWEAMKALDVGYETLVNYLGEEPVAELCLDIQDLSDSQDSGPNGHNVQNWQELKSTIVLNSANLNRSKLDIARTLLHEMIHSELFSMVVQAGRYEDLQNFAITYQGQEPFLILWNYYSQYGDYIEDVQSGWQHEYMADYYIDYISEGLASLQSSLLSNSFYNYWDGQSFSPTNNISTTWDWDDFYTALAWSGLKQTDEWNNLPQQTKDLYDGYTSILLSMESSSYECE